jgi:hypothetical protein
LGQKNIAESLQFHVENYPDYYYGPPYWAGPYYAPYPYFGGVVAVRHRW